MCNLKHTCQAHAWVFKEVCLLFKTYMFVCGNSDFPRAQNSCYQNNLPARCSGYLKGASQAIHLRELLTSVSSKAGTSQALCQPKCYFVFRNTPQKQTPLRKSILQFKRLSFWLVCLLISLPLSLRHSTQAMKNAKTGESTESWFDLRKYFFFRRQQGRFHFLPGCVFCLIIYLLDLELPLENWNKHSC